MKKIIVIYVMMTTILSLLFMLNRDKLIEEIPFSYKNMSFSQARGVRFYVPPNQTRFWLDCAHWGQDFLKKQRVSICDLPDTRNLTAHVSGHHMAYFSWYMPPDDDVVPHQIDVFDANQKLLYQFKWSQTDIADKTQNKILFHYFFYVFLVIPALLIVIPFSIKLAYFND